MAKGTPEQVATDKESWTGRYLKDVLDRQEARRRARVQTATRAKVQQASARQAPAPEASSPAAPARKASAEAKPAPAKARKRASA